MKNTFVNPEINVEKFSVEDVITTSSTNDSFVPGDNETGLT